jgi:hypothetical protein
MKKGAYRYTKSESSRVRSCAYLPSRAYLIYVIMRRQHSAPSGWTERGKPTAENGALAGARSARYVMPLLRGGMLRVSWRYAP